MPLTNVFRDAFTAAVIGGTFTPFNNANTYMGVGDSSTAFAVGQTDLQASTNKLRKAMDATYPQQAANVLTFRSTFGTSDANFAWAEWAIFNASTSGVMMNRVVASNGSKSSNETKVATATMTFTV
jgi:hypothetical protein